MQLLEGIELPISLNEAFVDCADEIDLIPCILPDQFLLVRTIIELAHIQD